MSAAAWAAAALALTAAAFATQSACSYTRRWRTRRVPYALLAGAGGCLVAAEALGFWWVRLLLAELVAGPAASAVTMAVTAVVTGSTWTEVIRRSDRQRPR